MPPPTGLWEPVPGATPSSGNFVFLESEPGDYVGQGGTYLYTQADSVITVEPISEGLDVAVVGDERWHGDFQGMIGLSQLEPGYYGDLSRYPFHNPTVGGLDWDGESRGCNNVSGWFVVDSVTYDGAALAAIDLRFEQHCEEGVPALHGEIHWDANDPTRPPGPLVPPPAGLWEPPPGTTPASGNYVYLESDPDDIVGAGGSYLYAPGNSQLAVNWNGSELSIAVNRQEYWQGRFQPMDSLDRIEVGYYGDLQGIPFNNPARGGLSWTGENANCNTLTGWFVVDGVTYDGPALDAIDLRFEQHCDGGDAALNGEIHWSR